MKKLSLGNQQYTLSKDGNWSGEDSVVVDLLEDLSKNILEEVSPADGDPFHELLNQLKLSTGAIVVENKSDLKEFDKEVVY